MSEPVSPEPQASSSVDNDRRGNPRRSTFAVFTMRFPETSIMGAGKNISTGGAYFVTSDEISVELCYEKGGKERRINGRLARVDCISRGTLGVAVEFDETLPENEHPD